jgi:DnaK suppressor protein
MSNGKSPYGRDELQQFRKLLLGRRLQFLESLRALEHDVRDYNEPEARNVQSDLPTHPADQSDRSYEQSKDLQIATTERDMIRQIEEALHRIDDRTYGLCLTCGRTIERRRLTAEPWAQLCIDDAR